MNKLIKLSETHYVIVDDSEIKEGDWIYHTSHGKKKITHSTKPLEEICYAVENDESLCETDFYRIKSLSLSEVEKAIYGYSVEKVVEECDVTFDEQGKLKLV